MNLAKNIEHTLTQHILESSIICILDSDLNITYCNDKFSNLLELPVNEVIGNTLRSYSTSESSDKNFSFIEKTLLSSEVWKGELQLRSKSNRVIYLDSTITPAKIEADKSVHICHFIDSMPRKQLIEGLKQRAHRQGLIAILGQVSLSSIPVVDLLEQALAVVSGSLEMTAGIILEISVDEKSALVKASYNTPHLIKGESVIAIERDNILGFTINSDTPLSSLNLDSESRFKTPECFKKSSYQSSTSLLIGDKSYPFGILILFSPENSSLNFDEINFLQSICNILAEAINRKHMETSLRHEKQLSKNYLDAVGVLILVLDLDKNIILSNQHASKTLGMPQQDLTGLNFIEHFIPENMQQKFIAELDKFTINPDYIDNENSILTNIIPTKTNKTLKQIKWHYSVIKNENSTANSVILAGEDITEILDYQEQQKRLERQLGQAQKMEAMGLLAGGIAHDFNNILASILGFSELALELIDDNQIKLKQYLNHVYESGIKARDIIEQMQTINLQDDVSSKPIILPALLKSTVKMLRSALPSSIDIDINIEPDIPTVYFNSSKFNQLLMQVLINARDALQGKGKINIALSREQFSNIRCTSCNHELSESYAVLTITDNGPGISDSSIATLHNNNPKSISETGLSIVNSILHASHGHLIIDSHLLHGDTDWTGTSIKMLFTENESINKKVERKPVDITCLKNNKVMIIDDENSIASYIGELFNNAGFDASVYCDSLEALSDFTRNPENYDLVITDQTMPGMTGDILSTKMLALKPEIPIILCTGHSNLITESAAHDLNIQGFLKKPVDSAELLHLSLCLLAENPL